MSSGLVVLLLGILGMAVMQHILQHRALTLRDPGAARALSGLCSVLASETNPLNSRYTAAAAGFGLHVHLRGGVWVPPQLP